MWEALRGRIDVPALVLADPIHLRYLANFHVDPFSLGADFGGVLVVRPDGHATLYHDRRLPESVQAAIRARLARLDPDAYEFARGKPLTLLSGSNLLHLLEKHGMKARIDLVEAKAQAKLEAARERA